MEMAQVFIDRLKKKKIIHFSAFKKRDPFICGNMDKPGGIKLNKIIQSQKEK